jgi:predicted SprT family Zn-dependent metalloprotease
MKKDNNIDEYSTYNSSSILDDPDNYINDELFDYLDENGIDYGIRESLQNEFQNEKETEDITNIPYFINSSQQEEDFDVYDYFAVYNDLYFDGKLGCVRLEWSKRMTTCAGIFYTKSTEYIIRLSEPLLKFRTIKEIKETLLHEMIHAWVQIEHLDQRDDRSGHGYNFKTKMYEINKSTGFNITVYHTFHDEVSYHKKHVWRCDGECKNKHPYYGYVRRAMNRAPGKNDLWWDQHLKTCGGKFIKIEEPENKKKILKENAKLKLPDDDKKNKEVKILKKENNKKIPEKGNNINSYKKLDDFFKLNKKN